MIKLLLKKQLFEIFKAYFVNTKKNESRSKASTVLYFAFFAVVMVAVMGGMFGALSYFLYPIVTVGFGWLYYAMFGIISVLLGVFGSVFSTYSGLYLAKDNDVLLSMPIPVSSILISRLLGVYLMGLLYSAVVLIPAFAVKFIFAGFTAIELLSAFLFLVLISLIVLVLSCAFGYVVARLSVKLKNRSYITVIISVAFFALYYYVYFNLSNIVRDLIGNVVFYGEQVKDKAYPVYMFGNAAEGNPLSLSICFAAVIALLVLTFYIISRSFLKIATSSNNIERIKVKNKKQKSHSRTGAMLLRELKRFTSSPNYMLNCGIGVLFMIAAAVFILIKRGDIYALVNVPFSGFDMQGLAAIIVVFGLFLLLSTNDTAAPSVSLEGKTLWQVRSLPVDTKTVLKAKYMLQILINIVPVILCTGCAVYALHPDFITAALMILLPASYTVLHALFSLYCGLHKVNLEWTNELVPIKQSMSVLFAIFGGWGYVVASGAAFYFTYRFTDVRIYFTVLLLITVSLCVALYRWINTKGVKIFENLHS